MAFGETSNADAAMAIIRLTRKIDALEKELEGVKAKARNQELQRVVDRSKMPKEGPRGLQGLPGERGPKGDTGPMPDHRWRGTALQFTRADGRWGLAVDLKGPTGAGGFVGGGGGSRAAATVSGCVLSIANVNADWVFPTSDPQIEIAVNQNAAKVNELLDALDACEAGIAASDTLEWIGL